MLERAFGESEVRDSGGEDSEDVSMVLERARGDVNISTLLFMLLLLLLL